ncbi:imelysin family protein [Pullulanibacillus sp. KACC 23026]|uniref:iron uptake system protein EfeO n=1 Tax=Pullulanibacillus sp. KACC 23026 TaxID=3028315 RepID=UPI0023B031B3|nr:iron uptake system protein EfeO [Pullulanibacillus sp. KACC 23026]WEG13714.1 imelysin family protein [Pullulanibacillus sp. KACC 23026]
MFHSRKLVFSLLGTLLLIPGIAGCSTSSSTTQKEGATAAATPQTAVQKGTKKMEDLVSQLQKALANKDIDEAKSKGKAINDQWLAYENSVRGKFPLLYADIEKYEQPIYAQSNMDQPDFKAMTDQATHLQSTLKQLMTAKETAEKESKVLNAAVDSYKQYVEEQVDQLVKTTQAFAKAIDSGNLTEAKKQYVAARPYYERIEPIAESLGDLDPRIDARINDVDDVSKWTGFHEIERSLYEKNTLDGQKKYADQLVSDVADLQEKVKTIQLKPKEMVAGAMDLLNEAATSKITGEEERYSHIDLVDLQANLDGSEAVYQAAIPALNVQHKELADQIDKQFQVIDNELLNYQSNGQFESYSDFEKNKDNVRQLSDELEKLSKLMAQTATIF